MLILSGRLSMIDSLLFEAQPLIRSADHTPNIISNNNLKSNLHTFFLYLQILTSLLLQIMFQKELKIFK